MKNNQLLKKHIYIDDITFVATFYRIQYTDLKTNKGGTFMVYPEKSNVRLFAPGFYFTIEYTTKDSEIAKFQEWTIDTERIYKTFEDWDKSDLFDTAMHGYQLEQVTQTPKNTFRYFTAIANKPERKSSGTSRNGGRP